MRDLKEDLVEIAGSTKEKEVASFAVTKALKWIIKIFHCFPSSSHAKEKFAQDDRLEHVQNINVK